MQVVVDNEKNLSLTDKQDPNAIHARSHKSKASRGVHPVLKFVLNMGIIALLVGAGYAGYLYFKLDDMIGKISDEESTEAQSSVQKPMVILLLGLDSRKETRTLNTDVIMAVAFNPQSKSATLVSLPRDAYMKPEGYKARKANHFYSVAMLQDKEPPDTLVKRLFGDFLDIPIDLNTA